MCKFTEACSLRRGGREVQKFPKEKMFTEDWAGWGKGAVALAAGWAVMYTAASNVKV